VSDLSGSRWQVVQSNTAIFLIDEVHDGANGTFTGKAKGAGGPGDGNIVRGHSEPKRVWFDIEWDAGPVGRYSATLGPDNIWTGITVNKNDPAQQATWYAYMFV
jgi:hypothetical protein